MGKIREGRWDCHSCQTAGILGRERVCTNCGKPRPDDTKFYLPKDQPIVTDEKLLQQATAGADWYCRHCGSGNSNSDSECVQCGAPKGSSPSHEVTIYEPGQTPRSEDEAEEKTAETSLPSLGSRTRIQTNSLSTGKFSRRALFILIALAGSIGLIGTVIFLLQTKDVSAEVTGKSWERSIAIEQYRTIREEDWSIPIGGRYVSQRQEIHHYRQVLDHYKTVTEQHSRQVPDGTEEYGCHPVDMGNGFFDEQCLIRTKYRTEYYTETHQEPVYRSEPVYQAKYTYDIDRWVYHRSVPASGQEDEPYWPEFTLGTDERAGGRSESYTLFLIDEDGKEHSYPADSFTLWDSYSKGEKVILSINRLGMIVDLKKKE